MPGWLDLRPDHERPTPRRAVADPRCPRRCRRSARACASPPRSRPIGAVVGEWVGSSAGLGYLMLHANARMQIDLMFAALFVLAVMALRALFRGRSRPAAH